MKLTVFSVLAPAAAAVAQSVAELPRPSGEYQLGVSRYEWVDSSRRDIAELFRRDSTGAPQRQSATGFRRIAAQVWYPRQPGGGGATSALYNPSGAAFVGVIGD